MTAHPGFGLRGLLLLVLFAGLVALVSVPQYTKLQEKRLAEEAAAIVQMIATTNRMYSLDHQKRWTEGLVHDGCNSSRCAAAPGLAPDSPCNLVACKYLAQQEWDARKYRFYSLDGTAEPGPGNVCGSFPALKPWAACTVRKTAADGDAAAPRFSAGWGYAVSADGVLFAAQTGGGADRTPNPSR
ncbi:MAG: hypothetical protein HY554_19220 [Elusimicrobia bacterium]|nr:hypothetical protein [Elusimicrobiota bacterium]